MNVAYYVPSLMCASCGFSLAYDAVPEKDRKEPERVVRCLNANCPENGRAHRMTLPVVGLWNA